MPGLLYILSRVLICLPFSYQRLGSMWEETAVLSTSIPLIQFLSLHFISIPPSNHFRYFFFLHEILIPQKDSTVGYALYVLLCFHIKRVKSFSSLEPTVTLWAAVWPIAENTRFIHSFVHSHMPQGCAWWGSWPCGGDNREQWTQGWMCTTFGADWCRGDQ